MLANLTPFLLHWAITAFGLWVAAHVFKGMRFDSGGALVWRRCCSGWPMRWCGRCWWC